MPSASRVNRPATPCQAASTWSVPAVTTAPGSRNAADSSALSRIRVDTETVAPADPPAARAWMATAAAIAKGTRIRETLIAPSIRQRSH